MSSFTEIVKEYCMYELSKYQFYRTRVKCTSVVNGLADEQYKILCDYGEKLKKTSIRTTMRVEGIGGVCKRMYVCLGGL